MKNNDTPHPRFTPLYQQIKVLLIKNLEDGQWQPGQAIPAETELATRYGVSQGTVRKAIDELAAENLVVRKQGRGTFVATHNEAKADHRFLRLFADDATMFCKPQSVYLSLERINVGKTEAQMLELSPNESVLLIRRLLQFGGHSQVFDEICLPAKPYKSLTLEHLQQSNTTFYALLEREFGVRMLKAIEHLKAVPAPSEQADLLGVELNQPLLFVERLSFTYSDQPVELRRGWYLTHDFSYRNELY